MRFDIARSITQHPTGGNNGSFPPMTRPEAERLAILETKMDASERHLQSMDAKLDDLLALRHKGVGAFWLASALTGTGIIGGLSMLWSWISK